MLGHRKRIAELELLVDQLRSEKHLIELDLVKAETLAEERKWTIERLERSLEDVGTPSTVPQPIPELPEEPPQASVSSLLERLDEICGVGLSPEQIEERHETYRRKQIEHLEAERRAILEELNGSS